MNQTSYDRGYQQGIEPAKELLRDVLLKIGTKRFGAPSMEIEARIRTTVRLAHLEEFIRRTLDADSWENAL